MHVFSDKKLSTNLLSPNTLRQRGVKVEDKGAVREGWSEVSPRQKSVLMNKYCSHSKGCKAYMRHNGLDECTHQHEVRNLLKVIM